MQVQLFHRGRFRPLPDARIISISANAWTVRLPLNEELQRMVKGTLQLESFDDQTFLVGDTETNHSIGTRLTQEFIELSLWVL